MKLCSGVGIDGNGCMGLLRDSDPDMCAECQNIVNLVRSVESEFDCTEREARESHAREFADQVSADVADDRYSLD